MHRALLSLIVALYLVLPASAARDFSVNTSNYMKRGDDWLGQSSLGGSAATSAHAWIHLDSLPSGVTWTVIRAPLSTDLGGPVGVHLTDSGGATRLLVGGRSSVVDSFQGRTGTGSISTGTWTSVGGVLNFAADTVTPYLNGAADNGGAVTFAGASYTHTGVSDNDFSDSIGAQINSTGGAVANTQVDGRIAEVAVWGGDIGAAGFDQLAKGVSPLQIRPDLLRFYLPLHGDSLTDIDTAQTYTITGTINKAAHPPMLLRHPGAH